MEVPDTTSPTATVAKSLPYHLGLPLGHPLDMTSVVLTKALLLGFDLTNLVLPWEPQSAPPMYPHKGLRSKSCCRLSLHSALSALCGPSGCAVYLLQDL